MNNFFYLKDDLISRSKLLMHLNDYALQEAPFIEGQSKEAYNAIQNCMKAVEDAPAVQAKYVVHGEWIDTEPEYHSGFRNNAHRCSNCSDYYTTEPKDLFFCPRCGADMRKKVQDGKID